MRDKTMGELGSLFNKRFTEPAAAPGCEHQDVDGCCLYPSNMTPESSAAGQHTPGPWQAQRAYVCENREEMPIIALVRPRCSGQLAFTPEDHANTRLLAAAPLLLAACELSTWVARKHRYFSEGDPCPRMQQEPCPYPGKPRSICKLCAAEMRHSAIATAKGEA